VKQVEIEASSNPQSSKLNLLDSRYQFAKRIGCPAIGNALRLKRLLDPVLGLGGVIVSLPLILFFGLLIKATSKGPIFYRQERVGLMGKPFKVIKLRSMYINAEAETGAVWAIKGDPRVTPVGRLIRRTRIDKLPQFWNVVRGEMSLIGPRPERPELTEQFSDDLTEFPCRLRVLPGITGYAQVNGGYDMTPKEKCRLDNYYIDHYSLWFDFKLLVKTFKIIFTGDGAR